jgi:hypothetical protein
VLFLTISVQSCYGSEVANPGPPPTLEELSGQFRHIFIGEVVSKAVAETETHYTFNVSAWLMNPLNMSQVQWTEGGGSVIMVIPSTTLYVGIDYLVYFDDYNETQVGIDRHFLVFNGIDDDAMAAFRGYLNHSSSAAPFFVPVPNTNKIMELARQGSIEAAEKAAGPGGHVASTAASNHADASAEEKIPVDLRPHALLVSWVLVLLILNKLVKK